MPLFRVGAEREPKTQGLTEDGPGGSEQDSSHTSSPPSASRSHLAENSASESIKKYTFPSIKKKGGRAQKETRIRCERPASDGKRHQGRLRRPWEQSSLRPCFQNLKKQVRMLSKTEQVDSHPRSDAPKGSLRKIPTGILLLPIFASTNDLRPAPLVVRPYHIPKPPSSLEQVYCFPPDLPGPWEILTCPPDLYESRSNS